MLRSTFVLLMVGCGKPPHTCYAMELPCEDGVRQIDVCCPVSPLPVMPTCWYETPEGDQFDCLSAISCYSAAEDVFNAVCP